MKIEKYLVLNKYLLSIFGINDFKDLQDKLKDAPTGVDSDGRSHFINVLRSSFEGLRKDLLSEEVLLRYDENIQSYVRKINFKREPITLKYFQYLAVLFTEIVLDNLKNRKPEFLYELNKFFEKYKQEQGINIIEPFTENDLKKLAFWMATGSGKTLIMHINYHQFFNYKLFSPDNIILITPNEGLSKQHFEELQKSGIPSRLYAGALNGGLRSDNEILVIEMTKFVEEKKGKGITLPVDVFEGRNLIFVDEGHKGRRSEEQKWARLRDRLSENGFVFEYSATFGQILSEKNKETLQEYAKSIIFDYSYKYFYLDGYGKDFLVLNVKQTKISDQEFQEGMFIANLLSFYEQLLAYQENRQIAGEYNIEKPLWIFVGTTVSKEKNKNTTQERENLELTDVALIVDFIRKASQDEEWTKKWIADILSGNTNLKDENGRDIFNEQFKYLRNKSSDIEELYNDLCKKIFGGKGNFSIYELKNAEGELGLKIGENDYFGVVNIGDVAGFKKQLEKRGISVEQDVISSSLFDEIKKENSKINILIGSKKFIEGWDTWRVSSMGLLNIGKEQGPQIIQLFGRGVRLKGKGMSLKRSAENSQIKLLETLNIYGIKADYLGAFLEAIRKEEVEFETIKIPVKFQHKDKWNTLYTLSKPEKKFEEEEILRLEIDEKVYFTLDLLPKVAIYLAQDRRKEGIKAEELKAEVERSKIPENLIDLLNWERIYQETIEFRSQRNYWNLVFETDKLREILLSDRYSILTLPEILEVKKECDIKRLEDIALLIIKKYIDLFYKRRAKRFETKNLSYAKVEQLPLPFISEKEQGYIVQIMKEKRNSGLIEKIKNLTQNLQELIREDNEILPRVYFDGSLYVPILLQSKEIKISPAGLVESEKEFVIQLRKYLKQRKSELQAEVYLLRNFPHSGIGFQLQWSKFYPDFIMWVKQEQNQKIVFIDPKGLEHSKDLEDEKIQFAKNIKEIEKGFGNPMISLESFILSATPYAELIRGRSNPPKKEDYEGNNVIFLEDEDWPEKLFRKLNI